MRTVVVAALLLAACSGEPLDITIPTLPGATELRMTDSPPGRRWQYRLQVESRVRKQVRLEARLEEPAPEGVVVRIAERTETIPRQGTGWPWLIVIAPKKEGAFKGTIAITSPDLPEWAVRYPFEGAVVPGAMEGKNLTARPSGVNVGSLRPGEEKTFEVVLSSVGTEPVTIDGWSADDPLRVRLPRPREAFVVNPGEEYKLMGAVVAPRVAGPFTARVRVRSDAQNHRQVLDLRLAGEVVPDYAPHPPRSVEPAAYPFTEPEFKVLIRAREAAPSFTVASASGHERYFEVTSLGTTEPAREQLVRFKLRRDAPTDASRDAEWQIRMKVEPGGVDVIWPVKIRLNPPIHATPASIDFRRLPQGKEKEQEIILAALPGRTFNVTAAYSEKRIVKVTLPERVPAMPWRVVVSLPKGAAAGSADDRVVIETDDPDVPRLVIPVK